MSRIEEAVLFAVAFLLGLFLGLWVHHSIPASVSAFSPSDWMMCEPRMVQQGGAPALALQCHRDTVVVLQDSIPLPQRPPVQLPGRPQS